MIEDLAKWFLVTHPEATVVLACLFALLFANRKGWISVSLRGRNGSQKSDVNPDSSGRRKAVQFIDVVDEHALDMPGHWEKFVDARAQHKAANLIQERVMPYIELSKARLDRMEPVVSELRVESKQTHESVIRLEEQLDAVKETVGEVKEGVEDVRETIATNAERTHEMLGRMLEKGKS